MCTKEALHFCFSKKVEKEYEKKKDTNETKPSVSHRTIHHPGIMKTEAV
jgi:hypothetical protein